MGQQVNNLGKKKFEWKYRESKLFDPNPNERIIIR